MTSKKKFSLNTTVVSIGGRGTNILNRLVSLEEKGIRLVSIGTQKSLRYGKDIREQIELPENYLLAEALPHEKVDALCGKSNEIKKVSSETDIMFILGNISNPINVRQSADIAEIAKQTDTLVFYVSATPFLFEGKKKKVYKEEGKEILEKVVDGVLCINSDKILAKGESANEGLQQVDRVIVHMMQLLADLVMQFGIINVDFSDLKTTVQDVGMLYFSSVEGSKKEIASLTENMFTDSILDIKLSKIKKALYVIHVGKDMLLEEIQTIGEKIQDHLDEHARIIFGVVEDKKLKNLRL